MNYMEQNETKMRMIEAALDLFHLQGVNATSVDQILRRSNTGKGQFSHYFKNKDGLIRAAFHYLDQVIRSGQAASNYELETWEDFETWFQCYIDFQLSVGLKRSCPMGTIGSELSDEQELIRQDMKLFIEWSRGKLARFFAKKQAAHELAPSANPDGLADLCLTVMQGGMLLTKIKRDIDIFKGASAQVIDYVKLLRK